MPNINKWGVDLDLVKLPDGRFRTQSMFLEETTGAASGMPFLYSLRPGGAKGLPSLKDIYMEVADPTEYDFALQALGSWELWQRLAGPEGPEWFRPYVSAWRMELEVKLRREAFLSMREMAKKKTDAARWLAEGAWEKRKPGRPSKQEVARERAIAAKVAEGFEDDAVRLGLKTH